MRFHLSSRLFAIFFGGILLASALGTASAQTLTWGAGGAGGSGQWDEGTTADWYNGSSNVPWTDGDAAVFAGTAGTVSIYGSVTASQVTFNTAGYTLQNFFLEGASSGLTVQTNADTTISSSIFGVGGTNPAGFTKAGTGLLLLNGGSTPVFFGSITVADGELRYGNATLNSSTPFVLGNTSAAALTFGSTVAAVGSLSGGGTTGGVVRPSATSGSSTLTIYGVGDATYAGTFAGNGNATLSLLKSGNATQTLTNASYSLAGSVTVNGGKLVLSGPNGALPNISGVVVNGSGTFQLDNGTDVNQTRLSTTLPVTLNGGTMSFVGNAASQDVHQTVGALNVASGASTVSVTSAGTGVSQLIFGGKLTRTSGATVSFTGGGHITVAAANDATGILGGYATVGADWASVNASNGVVAYAGYSTDTTTANTTDNLRIAPTSATASLAGVQTRNSLNLVNIGSTAATVDLGANGSLVLTSGGLLTSGGNGFVIQNGKLASGTGELVITNQSALTISSPINSAVTKSGAGTLTLAGSNTYTGTTTINQGTVQVSADANLGGGTTVALNGGTLQATTSFTSTKSLQGNGGMLDAAVGSTVTFTGGTNMGSFTKVGAGTLALTGQVGSITVNSGTLQLTNLTGTTTSAVTLNNARLEAGINGLQYVTSNGGANAVLSPGPHGQAQTLPIGYFSVLSPTVIDFDVGSAGHDLLLISFNLNLATSNPALLFRFNNLGGVQTGMAYSVLELPSSQVSAFTSTAGFGIDAVSAAAGYRGAFSIVNGFVDVTFSAVPEPSVNFALLCGVLGGGAWRLRRAARVKCAN